MQCSCLKCGKNTLYSGDSDANDQYANAKYPAYLNSSEVLCTLRQASQYKQWKIYSIYG